MNELDLDEKADILLTQYFGDSYKKSLNKYELKKELFLLFSQSGEQANAQATTEPIKMPDFQDYYQGVRKNPNVIGVGYLGGPTQTTFQQSTQKNGSPEFYRLLDKMGEIHHKKSNDYASNDSPYGNYEFSGWVASIFSHSPEDMGFIGRIAEKMYRIANLEKDHKEILNESIEDSESDICVITLLWMAARRERRNKKTSSHPAFIKTYSCYECGLTSSIDIMQKHQETKQHRGYKANE